MIGFASAVNVRFIAALFLRLFVVVCLAAAVSMLLFLLMMQPIFYCYDYISLLLFAAVEMLRMCKCRSAVLLLLLLLLLI